MTSSAPTRQDAGPPLVSRWRPGQAAHWPRRFFWIWPALVTTGLGLYRVTGPEPWRDELASWAFASRGLGGLLATGRSTDASSLLYYFFLHVWMSAFGSSLLALRVPSVLAMGAAAAFVALAARDLAGTRAGLTAGLVFAIIPAVSRYAQEIRFYALAMCFAALATWLLIRALDRPTWIRWAWYGAVMAVLGYLNLVAMALLAGHAAWTALHWARKRDLRLTRFAAAAVMSVGYLVPLILLGSREAGSQVKWVPRPGLVLGMYTRYSGSLFFSHAVAIGAGILIVAAWAVAVALRREPRIRHVTACLTVSAVIPLAVVWVVSQGQNSYFYPRYLLFTLIMVAVLIGVAASRVGRVPAIAAVVLLAGLGVHDQTLLREFASHNWGDYRASTGPDPNEYQQAARIVGANAKPGDGIVYPDKVHTQFVDTDLGMDYYLGGYLKPGVRPPHVLFEAETAAQANARYPVRCAQPARCVGDEARVWLASASPAWNPFKLIQPSEAAVLRQHYFVRHEWRDKGLTIVLLARHKPAS